MAVMMGSLYAALREAGVPDEKALRAAEEMAAINDISDMKGNLASLKSDVGGVKTDLAAMKADIAVMKWMLGFALAMMAAVLVKVFFGGS